MVKKKGKKEQNASSRVSPLGLSLKVGIAGCGGLGSNCASNLVRCGFTRLKIVDFDIVEESNLNRQFFFFDQVGMPKVEALAANLKRINPEIRIEAVRRRIDSKNPERIFLDCDIVAECLDRAEDKSMLASSFADKQKFIVMASGVAGVGASDNIKIRRIGKNMVIVGDFKTDVKETSAFSPRVNVAAAKQADVILDYALKRPAL